MKIDNGEVKIHQSDQSRTELSNQSNMNSKADNSGLRISNKSNKSNSVKEEKCESKIDKTTPSKCQNLAFKAGKIWGICKNQGIAKNANNLTKINDFVKMNLNFIGNIMKYKSRTCSMDKLQYKIPFTTKFQTKSSLTKTKIIKNKIECKLIEYFFFAEKR